MTLPLSLTDSCCRFFFVIHKYNFFQNLHIVQLLVHHTSILYDIFSLHTMIFFCTFFTVFFLTTHGATGFCPLDTCLPLQTLSAHQYYIVTITYPTISIYFGEPQNAFQTLLVSSFLAVRSREQPFRSIHHFFFVFEE
jgi:hypothetical protein